MSLFKESNNILIHKLYKCQKIIKNINKLYISLYINYIKKFQPAIQDEKLPNYKYDIAVKNSVFGDDDSKLAPKENCLVILSGKMKRLLCDR